MRQASFRLVAPRSTKIFSNDDVCQNCATVESPKNSQRFGGSMDDDDDDESFILSRILAVAVLILREMSRWQLSWSVGDQIQ